jgi:hypothetical protein
MEELPEAERSWVLVEAMAKTSLALGWAALTVWRVRYCLDCSVLRGASGIK